MGSGHTITLRGNPTLRPGVPLDLGLSSYFLNRVAPELSYPFISPDSFLLPGEELEFDPSLLSAGVPIFAISDATDTFVGEVPDFSLLSIFHEGSDTPNLPATRWFAGLPAKRTHHPHELFDMLWQHFRHRLSNDTRRTLRQFAGPFPNRFGPLADLLMSQSGEMISALQTSPVISEIASLEPAHTMEDILNFVISIPEAAHFFWEKTLVESEKTTLLQIERPLHDAGFLTLSTFLNLVEPNAKMPVPHAAYPLHRDASVLAYHELERIFQEPPDGLVKIVTGSEDGNTHHFFSLDRARFPLKVSELFLRLRTEILSRIEGVEDEWRAIMIGKSNIVAQQHYDELDLLLRTIGGSPILSSYFFTSVLRHDDRIALAHALAYLHDSGITRPFELLSFLFRNLAPVNGGTSVTEIDAQIKQRLELDEDLRSTLDQTPSERAVAKHINRILSQAEELLSPRMLINAALDDLFKVLIRKRETTNKVIVIIFLQLVRRFSATRRARLALWLSLSPNNQQRFRRVLLKTNPKEYREWLPLWVRLPHDTTPSEQEGFSLVFGPSAKPFDEMIDYVRRGRVAKGHPVPLGNSRFTFNAALLADYSSYLFSLVVPQPLNLDIASPQFLRWAQRLHRYVSLSQMIKLRFPRSEIEIHIPTYLYVWMSNIYIEAQDLFHAWRQNAYRIARSRKQLPFEVQASIGAGMKLLESIDSLRKHLHAVIRNIGNSLQVPSDPKKPNEDQDIRLMVGSTRSQLHDVTTFSRTINMALEKMMKGEFDEELVDLLTFRNSSFWDIAAQSMKQAKSVIAAVHGPKKEMKFETLGNTITFLEQLVPRDADTATLLQRLLNELYINGAKYPVLSKSSKITLNATNAADFIHIHYSDNGLGIKPETLEAIMSGAVGQREHDHLPGSGVGLATRIQMIRDLGGDISITSIPESVDPEHSGISIDISLPLSLFK